ncbi:MAG: heme ABC exporter ATP-binding protein CcmA [Armatimonas sp.]
MGIALELNQIEKRFGGRRVLKGIGLSAQGGSVVAVTGPNGTGKSTLIKIVAGLMRPTKGEISLTIEGADCSSAALRRQSVGYVAPDLALYPELSGRENLEFFIQVRGGQKVATKTALETVGLGDRGEDSVSVYSSGMRQRLRLALAMLFEPPLLLLDEPGLALDAGGVAMLEGLIASRKQAGALVLLATNDAREVALGDRVLEVNVAA